MSHFRPRSFQKGLNLFNIEGLLNDEWSFRIFNGSSFSSWATIWFLDTDWIWIRSITNNYSAWEFILMDWWCLIEFKCSVTDSNFRWRISRSQIVRCRYWIGTLISNNVIINIIIISNMMNFTIGNSKDKSRWETD